MSEHSEYSIFRSSEAQHHFHQGLGLYKERRLDEAIAAWRAVLRLHPDDAESQYLIGRACAEQTRLDEAIQAYQAALDIHPDYTEAYYRLGAAYAEQGKINAAIQALNRAVDRAPDDVEIHLLLGSVYLRQNDRGAATDVFEHILSLAPEQAEAHYQLALIQHENGHLAEALQGFQKAALLGNRNARIKLAGEISSHFEQGSVYFQRGKYEPAIEAYQLALDILSDNPDINVAGLHAADVHYALGQAYRKQGEQNEAIKAWQIAAQNGSKEAEAALLGLGIPVERAQEERARQLFEQLASEEPPMAEEGTNPAATSPRLAVSENDLSPATSISQKSSRSRWLGLGMMVVALLLLVATVFLLLLPDNDTDGDSTSDAVSNVDAVNGAEAFTATPAVQKTSPYLIAPEMMATFTPTPTATTANTDTVMVTDEPAPSTQGAVETPAQATQAEPFIEPTAADDEIAVALLTPVPQLASYNTRPYEAFTITGDSGRNEVVPYQVQSGDTLIGIADRFGLEVCTIVWSNPLNKVNPLRPGNTLNIMPVDGVFYKIKDAITIQQIADDTGVSPYAIIDSPFNDLFEASPETVLVEGMQIVVPEGDGGECQVWNASSGGNGLSAGSSSGGSGGLWGCSYTMAAGSFPVNNPVQGRYTFTNPFSMAHSGVDLAGSPGTTIGAAGAGTVAFAGWNEYGYGKAIVIDHGGTYTLYAHLSAINVNCGQAVGALEAIGAMGSTGRSSGPHLHFEIRDGSFNPVDPSYTIAF